ncbi:hypothetical protein I4641_23160 [Waterburya agarophytonicola K14]|uniref:Uncharacterized protein n=1 Tax=Waterburya agarophytonicola KI4 TaxID=2874699 RepID=A0A964BWL2_9CYAN|nr:hypothetical protein [Waterburya agarophytonicola]MCC0179841.1 hypothetical protein [Waterburya agarophytonicola KI4]
MDNYRSKRIGAVVGVFLLSIALGMHDGNQEHLSDLVTYALNNTALFSKILEQKLDQD